MNALIPLSILDINTGLDTEPRILDTRLADVLGFSRARKIRDMIIRNKPALERFGEVCTTAVQTSGKGGRPSETMWLNEKQALFLCAKSDAPNAVEVTIQMVEVFHAVITGANLPAVADHTDMLSDLSHRTENALMRMQEVTTNEVGSVRGYLKTGVVAPLSAHHDYVQERFTNLHKANTKFHDLVKALMLQMSLVLALANRAVQPDAFVASEWKDIGGVYMVAGKSAPIPQQRALSGQLSRSLDAFCIDTGRQIRNSPWGKRHRVWHVDAVRAWLKDRGARQITEHLAKHSGQTVIQFPGNPVEGGAK